MNFKTTLTGKYNSVLLNFAIFLFFLSKAQLATLKLRFAQPQLLPCSNADQKSTANKFPGNKLPDA